MTTTKRRLASAARTANITRVYRQATPEQVEKGLAWYDEAHSTAVRLAEQYGVTVDAAAGVIAALSPMMSWAANVLVAERTIREQGHATSGAMGANLAKANRILLGENPADVLTSRKVGAFYATIATRGETHAVTVDRHAYDIAVNMRHEDATRPTMTARQYADIADKYRRAASILGVSAAQVQAVTWVAWRARYWSAGAFDTARSAA